LMRQCCAKWFKFCDATDEKACYSNQSCARVGFFESKLRRGTLENLLSTASVSKRLPHRKN
jgi:hypothetical protein